MACLTKALTTSLSIDMSENSIHAVLAYAATQVKHLLIPLFQTAVSVNDTDACLAIATFGSEMGVAHVEYFAEGQS